MADAKRTGSISAAEKTILEDHPDHVDLATATALQKPSLWTWRMFQVRKYNRFELMTLANLINHSCMDVS